MVRKLKIMEAEGRMIPVKRDDSEFMNTLYNDIEAYSKNPNFKDENVRIVVAETKYRYRGKGFAFEVAIYSDGDLYKNIHIESDGYGSRLNVVEEDDRMRKIDSYEIKISGATDAIIDIIDSNIVDASLIADSEYSDFE